MREERAVRDRGLTLTELLVVVALMGVIAVVTAAVFTAIVRSTPSAEASSDDARPLLGLSTWLPADISSTPFAPHSAPGPAWDRDAGTSSGCSGGSPGVNLLRLNWSETFGDPATTSTFTSAYRYVDEGSGWKIKRYHCVNGGAPSVTNLTSVLPPIDETTWVAGTDPVVVEWQTAGSVIVGASFAVKTIDGDSVRVDGSSNNPGATLPPLATVILESTTTLPPETTTTTLPTTTTDPSATTIAPTTTAAPTTIAPTTTQAPTTTAAPTTTVPCTASITSVAPSAVRNQHSNSAQNDVESAPIIQEVTVTVQKSGNCVNLGLEYHPIFSGSVRWLPFGGSLQVILPSAALEPWDDGAHPLVLRDGQSGIQINAATSLMVS